MTSTYRHAVPNASQSNASQHYHSALPHVAACELSHSPQVHMVTFFTPDKNSSHNLSQAVALLERTFAPHIRSFSAWTPARVSAAGGAAYVRNFPEDQKLALNPGLHHIGFGAFKPFILLHAMGRLRPGETLVYRDANCIKYPRILDAPKRLGQIAEFLLHESGSDVVMPAQDCIYTLRRFCKSNVLRELGGGVAAIRDYPLLRANFIAVRNTPSARWFLQEWMEAVKHDEWMAPEPHPEPRDPTFLWPTPEQCLFAVVAAKRALRGALPMTYPSFALDTADRALACSGLKLCPGLNRSIPPPPPPRSLRPGRVH